MKAKCMIKNINQKEKQILSKGKYTHWKMKIKQTLLNS